VIRKIRLALLLPLIVVDCALNVFPFCQSWKHTLSAEAWWHRDHKYWFWCHRFIDAMPWFGEGHCQGQAELEEKYGSVWAALRAGFKE
jgi:hypothetical protein